MVSRRLCVVILGGDSFIAKKFVSAYNDKFDFTLVSMYPSGACNEVVVEDMFLIPDKIFLNADVVINFLAIVHRPDITDKTLYDKVNYQLAILNAGKAKQLGAKHFIQMSTIAVYGNVSNISIKTPCIASGYYGESKLRADLELLKLHCSSFNVAILRPPMVYGGGKAPGNMLRLIKLVDRGIPLPFKCIDNKRDFIHVKNLVQYLALIAEQGLNGIYLVADKQPVSTEHLLTIISSCLEKKERLVKVPEWILQLIKKFRPLEFRRLYGSLQIDTNFPFEDHIKYYSLEDGIREMVSWYKTRNQV